MICQHNLSHQHLRHYYLESSRSRFNKMSLLYPILLLGTGFALSLLLWKDNGVPVGTFCFRGLPHSEIIEERIILRSLSANMYLQLHQRPHRLRRVCQQPAFSLLWPVRPLRPFVPRQPNSAVTATSLATYTCHLIYFSVGRSTKSR